ncbi:restriction endonuclease [Pseudomonas paeninsulae]|uniref:restriction endonuclease n=1 Tax=Pseudomonas paeninsulae TaxID=3110772 RepID=UPI002D7A32FE|nr:restriction endonuclease [Pseudomonas sp. IT1137]
MIPPFTHSELDISPKEFELLVKNWITQEGDGLTSLEVTHDSKLEAHDSTYQIDVLAKFQGFGGAEFIVLIECKKYSSPVERETVQILHDKVRSLGAHKGMLFTTTGFQSGAIKYAKAHGIALIRVTSGSAAYQTRSSIPVEPPVWLNLPKFMAWHIHENDTGSINMSALKLTVEDLRRVGVMCS